MKIYEIIDSGNGNQHLGYAGSEKEAIQLKDLSAVPDFVEDDEDYDVEPPTIEESK